MMPSHAGKYYQKLLTILDEAQAEIQSTLNSEGIQVNREQLSRVEDILKMQNEVQRVGHALWNLVCIFYRIGNFYGPKDNYRSMFKAAAFLAMLYQNIDSLCANILLLDVDIKGNNQNELFSFLNQQNRDTYKQKFHVNHQILFKFGVVFVHTLNQLKADERTAALYQKMDPFWQNTLRQLPDTITENLLNYFNRQTVEERESLTKLIPKTPFNELLTPLIHRKPAKAEDEKHSDIQSFTVNDGEILRAVDPKLAPPAAAIHVSPTTLSDALKNWETLKNKYFSSESPNQFHACLSHYKYSLYNIFEIVIAYFWFIRGYDYGQTRQERRISLIEQLSQQMEKITDDIKELQNPEHLKGLEDLSNLRKTISMHVNSFKSILGDRITDCLVNLDHDIYRFIRLSTHKNLSHPITFGFPVHQDYPNNRQIDDIGYSSTLRFI